MNRLTSAAASHTSTSGGFNPFRSKSTPPMPPTPDTLHNRYSISGGGHRISSSIPNHMTNASMDQHNAHLNGSNFLLRKTSSGALLQGKQSQQIEELEKVI